jgi:hypothetical protein
VLFSVVTNAGSCSNRTNNLTNGTISRRQLDADTHSQNAQNAIQNALSQYYGVPVVVEEWRAPNSSCVNDSLMVNSFFATEVPSRDNEPILPALLALSLTGLPNQTVPLTTIGEVNYFWVKARVVGNDCTDNTTAFTDAAKQAFAEKIQNDLGAVPVNITSDTKCERNRQVSDMTAIVLLPGALPTSNVTNMSFPETAFWQSQSAAVTAAPIIVGGQAAGQPCGSDGDCASTGRRASLSCRNNVCTGAGDVGEPSCCAALDCSRITDCETSGDGTQCKCELNGGGIAMIVLLSLFGLCLLCVLLACLATLLRGRRKPPQRVEDPAALRAPHLENVRA